MNSLSWFIYLAQVVDNISGAASAFLITTLVAVGFLLVFLPMLLDVIDFDELPTKKIIVRFAATCSVVFLVFIVTPSRQTMLLIAGSEIGERLVKSDGVTDAVNPGMDLIRKWIKQEADKIKEK